VVKYYCDGCNRLLSSDELESNQKFQTSLQNADKPVPVLNEVWCQNCQNFAQDYWDEKSGVVKELLEYSNNRINNHRKTFFKKIKRNIVNDSGKIAGSDREEAHQ
jgi:hypothetical protein